MLEFKRGQREPLKKLCGGSGLEIEIYNNAPMGIEVYCFCLNPEGRLSEEHDFLFGGCTKGPENCITLNPGSLPGSARFTLIPERVPERISRFSFAVAADGGRTMRELDKGGVMFCGSLDTGRYRYNGSQFGSERAIVICDVYRHNGEWRVQIVGRGFNGGFKSLLEHFGGTVNVLPPSDENKLAGKSSNPISGKADGRSRHNPVNTRIYDMLRQCQGRTEYLSGLFRALSGVITGTELVEEMGLRVVMCADASGSMYDMYRSGQVQRAVDKFFAFACAATGLTSMDMWAFGAKSRQFEAVNMANVRDYTFAESGGYDRWMSMLNYQINNEPEAMRDITMIYGGMRAPVMVLFLTDGRLNSDWEIEEILIKTSRYPIYWQFIGLHGEEYGILEHLSEIDGRRTDNAGFIALDHIDEIPDNELYRRMFSALNRWMNEIVRVGLCPNPPGALPRDPTAF